MSLLHCLLIDWVILPKLRTTWVTRNLKGLVQVALAEVVVVDSRPKMSQLTKQQMFLKMVHQSNESIWTVAWIRLDSWSKQISPRLQMTILKSKITKDDFAEMERTEEIRAMANKLNKARTSTESELRGSRSKYLVVIQIAEPARASRKAMKESQTLESTKIDKSKVDKQQDQ